jgi:hypothetical protein
MCWSCHLVIYIYIYGRLQSKVHWNCESVKGVGDPIWVIPKVRKTQHQNPEFGHTEGEIL